MKTKLVLILLASLLTACAELEVITSNPRVEPPETGGQARRWMLGAVSSSAHRYTATQSAAARPPDLSHPEVKHSQDFHPTGYYSATKALDLGLEINVLGGSISAMSKLQLHGEPLSESKAGNLPIAVFARLGRAAGDNKGDQSETFGAGGYPWSAEVTNTFATAGVSAGYRTNDWLLIYGGFAIGKYWADLSIDQKASNNGASPAASYSKLATGEGWTISAGSHFNLPHFQIYAGADFSRIDYNDGAPDNQTSLHIGTFTK